ncbi:MAG: MFS transporter [Alphaproteobacteria bacterium]|nr:MFS transporter [Alphaproteobacteria bacterium]
MSPVARRNIRLLSAFSFCNDFRIYAPIMVVYFTQVTGSFALATLLFSIAKIAGSAFEVPMGIFSDMIGRRLTVVLGQIASVASITLYALGHDFTLLAIGAVLEGLAFSLFSGNNEALLYGTLQDDGAVDQYSEYQGRVSSMFQLALAVSAAVAAVALGWLPLRMMVVLSIIPAVLGIIFAALLTEPKRSDAIPSNVFAHLGEALAGFARDVRLRDLSLTSMLGFAIGESKHMFHPAFFALLWPAWALGVAGFLVHGFGALGFRIGGWSVRRFGEFRVLVGSNAGSIAAGLTAVAIPTVASPAIISVASIMFGPAMVSLGSLMQKGFSDAQRATMGSLTSLGGNILFAIAMFAIGALADRVGARFALLAAEIATIPVTLLYWRLYRSA